MVVITRSELQLKTKNDEKIYIIEDSTNNKIFVLYLIKKIFTSESPPEKKTPTLNNNKRLQALLILTISILVMMILFLIFKNSHDVDSRAEQHLLQEKTVEKPLDFIIDFKITSSTKGFLFPSSKSFYNASSYCEYHGMKLYKINSNYKQNLIFYHTEKMFSSGGGTRIWVNGKWSSDHQKWLSYPDKEVIFPSSESYERDEHCLAIQSFRRNLYDIASVSCIATNYFYCES